MNPHRQHLQACRPGERDLAEPEMQAARAELERDPALAQWRREEEAFDRAFSAKLGEAPVPAGLKDDLLKALAEQGAHSQEPVAPLTRWPVFAWFRRPVGLSLAASILVLFAVAALFLGPQKLEAELPSFYRDAARRVREPSTVRPAATQEEVSRMLTLQRAPSPGPLPVRLRELRSTGCRSYEWRGRSIGVVQLVNGEALHLFILNRQDFPKDAPTQVPVFSQTEDYAISVWTDSGRIYVLMGPRGSVVVLQQLF